MTRGPSFLHTPAPATTDHPVLRKRPPPSDPLGHVLIVDDNEINLRVAKSLCELLGMTSEFARDGLDAVDAATNGAFDLILMDICMPGMDGLEAARVIRALPGPAGEVPIVAVTANVEAHEVASYLAAGMRAVVAKPVKVSCLVAAIREALETGPRQLQALSG